MSEARYICNSCGTVIVSSTKPLKCSCGSKNIQEYTLSKNELLEILNSDYFKKEEENPFLRSFLNEEIDEEERMKKILLRCYEDVNFVLDKYLDLNKDYIKIISLWIMGTWFHDQFETYPYLYLNAMRGSGKTRLLKLIAAMSRDGEVQNSITEAVLFRTNGTLCLDEFERGGRKGSENVLELLNSAYKKGTFINRIKKIKTAQGEEMVIEKYSAYRPISLANITGIDNVLGDRCVKITLEKSLNEKKTRLLENLLESQITQFKEVMRTISSIQCSLCSVVTPKNLTKEWNFYILNGKTTFNYTTTFTTLTTLTTLNDKFKKIRETKINGRDLELSFPILIIAMWIDGLSETSDFFNKILGILENIAEEKLEDESIENIDFSLYDYLSQEEQTERFIQIKSITEGFRQFVQIGDEWLNNRWMGRALSRLNLVKKKRRLNHGIEVQINFEKAKEKTKLFK